MAEVEIGVIGGSGFYGLLEDARELRVETPYGPPSDVVSVGEVAGRTGAFLPPRGRGHVLPPPAINYPADPYSPKSPGRARGMGPRAGGRPQPKIPPRGLVV